MQDIGELLVSVVLISVPFLVTCDPQCNPQEFLDIRTNYENCANDKILTITSKIQNQLLQTEHERLICNTVKELIDVCGEFLLKCFSQQQVS